MNFGKRAADPNADARLAAALRVSELVDLNVNDVARHSESIVLTIIRAINPGNWRF